VRNEQCLQRKTIAQGSGHFNGFHRIHGVVTDIQASKVWTSLERPNDRRYACPGEAVPAEPQPLEHRELPGHASEELCPPPPKIVRKKV